MVRETSETRRPFEPITAVAVALKSAGWSYSTVRLREIAHEAGIPVWPLGPYHVLTLADASRLEAVVQGLPRPKTYPRSPASLSAT